jgi:hypothetical protein
MYRRVLRVLFCVSVSICAFAQVHPDPTEQQAVETIDKARGLSNLHQESTLPFRLQATFETYDYKGVPDGTVSFGEPTQVETTITVNYQVR